MLERLLSNGARTIIVECPDRFARDLIVQLAGHDMLKAKGIALIAASAPTFFLEDTPTAVLVRQVLGAIAQFEKAGLVANWRLLGSGSALRPGSARAGRATQRQIPRRWRWPRP
jgi:DNA invertase Pin-like site-specific DNA recombinase